MAKYGMPSRDRSDSPSSAGTHAPNFAPLIKSLAVGGPRDGIKIEAAASWDGRVLKRTDTVGKKYNHAGHYELDTRINKETRKTETVWQWINDMH